MKQLPLTKGPVFSIIKSVVCFFFLNHNRIKLPQLNAEIIAQCNHSLSGGWISQWDTPTCH